ncbi:MAG: hypothetical protein JNM83_27995 [Myxococcales bacterium]|jgi:hypothetical protein|nr:hypothetical protein [Myxococcales bacterium]
METQLKQSALRQARELQQALEQLPEPERMPTGLLLQQRQARLWEPRYS